MTGSQRMRAGRGAGDDVNSIRTSNDGKFVLIGLQSGAIELWKVRGFKKACEYPVNKGIVYDAEFTADEAGILTVGRDGHIKSWTITTAPDPAGGPDIYSLVADKDVIKADVRLVTMLADKRVVGATVDGAVVEIAMESVPHG